MLLNLNFGYENNVKAMEPNQRIRRGIHRETKDPEILVALPGH